MISEMCQTDLNIVNQITAAFEERIDGGCYINNLISQIMKMKIKDRQEYLEKNDKLLFFLNKISNLTDKLFVTMCFMVGSYIWIESSIEFTKFWNNNSDLVPLNQEMCCYDAILYASYLCKINSKKQILNIPMFSTINKIHSTNLLQRLCNIEDMKNTQEIASKSLWKYLGGDITKLSPLESQQPRTTYLCCVLQNSDKYIRHWFLCHNTIVVELNNYKDHKRPNKVSFSTIDKLVEQSMLNKQTVYIGSIGNLINLDKYNEIESKAICLNLSDMVLSLVHDTQRVAPAQFKYRHPKDGTWHIITTYPLRSAIGPPLDENHSIFQNMELYKAHEAVE